MGPRASPDVRRLYDRFAEGAKQLENFENDLSPSNFAILILPVLVSIPPISAVHSASDAATIWYAFATDILAALPLLIKGIEVMVSSRPGTPEMVSWLGMMGSRYGLFEAWYGHCFAKSKRVNYAGYILLCSSVWFIFASCYAEFLFWRKMRVLEGRLQTLESLLYDAFENSERESDSNSREVQQAYCSTRKLSLVIVWILFVAMLIGLGISEALVKSAGLWLTRSDMAQLNSQITRFELLQIANTALNFLFPVLLTSSSDDKTPS